MYQPAHNQFIERDSERLHRLIRAYPLGTLISLGDGGVEANHVPFLIDAQAPAKLTAHVPRANPVWRQIDGQSVLVIFHGPNAYISPSWYASKAAHGKVVPTWNYAVVHVRGTARAIDDRTWLRNHLDALTAAQESKFEHPWAVADAPAEYVDKLIGGIIGIEIAIDRLDGKFKLGQNRLAEDKLGVARALSTINPELARLGDA